MTYLTAMFLAFAGPAAAPAKARVPLQPFDFRQPGEVPLSAISQMESERGRLYLRSFRDSQIAVIDADGNLVTLLGGDGGHPSEFNGQGVLALAVNGADLWAIGFERRQVRRFTGGQFKTSFRLASYNAFIGHPTSNVFAASDRYVVTPAHPETGHLAAVYQTDGKLVKHVGELLPFDEATARRLPGINDTFWLRDGENWLSVHKFFPMATRYDGDFRQTAQFEIRTEEINQLSEKILDFAPNERFNTPNALITDAKIHKGRLFLMIAGRLHETDLADGAVRSITAFYGEGEDFAAVTNPYVTLFFFAFLDDDTLALAHPGMLWNHPLWKAKLPK